MPTARELLEQADALMRRNRADPLDDIPVLTDVVPAAPAAFLREPDAEVGIPVLVDEVVPGAEPAPAREPDEGEPSDWLEDVERSVIGEAPDSIAMVPPVQVVRPVDPALLASAEHEEIDLKSAEDDAFDAELGVTRPASETPATEVASSGEGQDGVETEEGEAPVVAEVVVEELLIEAPETTEDEVDDAAAWQLREAREAQAAREAQRDSATPVLEGSTIPDRVVTVVAAADAARAMMAAAPAIEAPVPGAFAAAVDDQSKWDALAEEVRIQVLQRIDLFTDTGLRDQLGIRLKPIVDRASADLVATINQHVGDLLRAYVAEAIEREIEHWRREH